MKCPRCNEHNLRNRLNKHGKRTRYCKGCGWEKVVVEKLTMEDDLAEIDAKINETPAAVTTLSPILPPIEPEIEILSPPNAVIESAQWMKDAEEEIVKATGIPAGLLSPVMARVIEKVAKPLPEDFPKPEVLVPVAEQKPKKRGLMSKVKGLFGKK
jgi:hypothetical protein